MDVGHTGDTNEYSHLHQHRLSGSGLYVSGLKKLSQAIRHSCHREVSGGKPNHPVLHRYRGQHQCEDV